MRYKFPMCPCYVYYKMAEVADASKRERERGGENILISAVSS